MEKISKIIEWGLYALVFLLPWQTKLILRQTELGGGGWEFGTIALYGTDILLIGLLTLLGIFLLCKRKGIRDNNEAVPESAVTHPVRPERPPLSRASLRFAGRARGELIWIILSGLDLFVFLSIFFAPDVVLAVYRYLLFLLGLGAFWLMVKAEYSQTKLAVAFFSGLLIEAGLAIGQFLLQATFASKWLGLALHAPGELGTAVIETVGSMGLPERWLRAYGTLDHPNILGGFLALGLIVFIYIYLSGCFEQNNADKRKIINKTFFLFSFLIYILALIFTFSRSAALALAFGIIILAVFFWLKKDWPALKRLGMIAAIALLLASVIFLNYQNLFITRTQAISRLELKSISERKTYQDDSLSLIRKDWLFGAGIGNYTRALAVKDRQRTWDTLNPVHDVFLLVWAEIGIFGLIFLVSLLFYLLAESFRKRIILNLSILSILVIIMMFDHYLWSLHFGILLFWISIGFIYKNLNKN